MNAPRYSFTMSPACRILDMLNAWFASHAFAPSYREIERLARVHLGRVRSYLDQLQAQGHLTHRGGEPRSIVLTRRMANVSDIELEVECLGRGWVVMRPPARTASRRCLNTATIGGL